MTSIGGQALIEGIMMRGPKKTAMAVRNTSGEMVIEDWDTKTAAKNKFLKLPLIRGICSYIDSMTTGYKCLMRSAEISGLEEAEEELKREKEKKKLEKQAKKDKSHSTEESATAAASVSESCETAEAATAFEDTAPVTASDSAEPAAEETEGKKPTKDAAEETEGKKPEKDVTKEKKKSSALTTAVMVLSVIMGLGLGIVLFVVVPSYLYTLIGKLFPSVADNRWLRSAFEGVIKIAIMVGYMAAVSLMKDIRRTFMFHGAEHKTIFCYENGLELTVENVRKMKRFHPRCGTSFLIIMLLIGIFIGFFIPPTIPTWLRVLIKLLLLPLIVGIGYELIKLAGRHNNLFTRIISAPGVWLQHITTKEPDDSMIECAIAAIREVIPDDGSDKW